MASKALSLPSLKKLSNGDASSTAVAPTPAEVREKAVAAKQKEVDAINASRGKNKGTRVFVGLTRGKNPQIITWEAFDDSLQETLPTSGEEFMTLTNTTEDKQVLAFLIEGYNSANQSAASDPIAEFINPAWDEDLQKTFRTVVRNYANGAKVPLETAVNLIRPGIDASHAANIAASRK